MADVNDWKNRSDSLGPLMSYPEKQAAAVFEDVAENQPHAVALVLREKSISYAELNERSNRIAHGLIQNGVQPGQSVALQLERGLEQIIAALAILKAGAAYVPLDPSLPEERLGQMVDDAQAQVVITSLKNLESDKTTNPEIPVGLESSAYIIFTSGSTGRPKGVEVPHRGLVRLVKSADHYIRLDPKTILLQMASISFDVSVFEIWGTLLNGGTLVLSPHKVPTLEQLGNLLERHRVNTLLMTAALFHLAIQERSAIFRPLEFLMVGGEALSAKAVKKALAELPNLCLMNAYGPTENSVNATVHVFDRKTFDPKKPVPIGKPVANTTAYVLDEKRQPVSDGEPGELVLGGDGVALGYAARPELTEAVFQPDPFTEKTGARMYCTGDLVRWNGQGELEFIGRTDHQVKLRGYRMELGEIETTLAEHPQVEQAVVVLVDDARGKRLCGFFQGAIDVQALEQFAAGKLPDYMIPSAWVNVEEWPLTSNGKIDRKALPVPELKTGGEVVYKTEAERELSNLWKSVLGLKTIPRDAGFFELGGDSLKALTLFLKIHEQFGRDLTLSALLEFPTLAALAAEIETDKTDNESSSLKLIRKGDDSLPPLFWVHGGDGHVLLFKSFAENFETEQTVYAFQYAGLDGRPGEPSVEEMARSYRDELLAVYPAGKIRLAGYCIGGYVVMELARLLKGTEIEVLDPLVVAGAPNVRAKSFRTDDPEKAEEFETMCRRLEAEKVLEDAPVIRAYEPENIGGLKGTRLYGLAREWRTKKRLSETTRAAQSGTSVPVESRGWYCGNSTRLAGEQHRSGGYDGDMLYLRSGVCHGAAMGFRGWWTNLYLGFDELCRGKFEGVVVGGLQEDFLKHPGVARLVKERFEADG